MTRLRTYGLARTIGSKLNVWVGRKTPQHFLIKGIKKLSKNLIFRLIFSATKTKEIIPIQKTKMER